MIHTPFKSASFLTSPTLHLLVKEMEGGELKLNGFWASPFCLEIEIALKLKGIPYTCEEENIGNESESLLRYNLIHKKIPVLVHNRKPIAESPVILEYIEET